jgi:hypothetical protein
VDEADVRTQETPLKPYLVHNSYEYHDHKDKDTKNGAITNAENAESETRFFILGKPMKNHSMCP